MRKVHCEACGAPYEVDPRRIPPNGMKMRCPACGASVQVTASPSPSVPDALADLDLDLPAPKLPRSDAKTASGASLPPAKAQGKLSGPIPQLDLNDLPAVKAQPSVPRAPRVPGIADELADLPAAKTPKPAPAARDARPGSAAGPAGSRAPVSLPALGDLDIDLPAAKPRAGAQDSRSALGQPRASIDFEARASSHEPDSIDLPATKSPATPGKEASLRAVARDARSEPLTGLDIDLPAAKPRTPAPRAATADARAPSSEPLASFDIDLPAAKPRAPGKEPARAAAAEPLGNLDIDLPAAKSPALGKQPLARAPAAEARASAREQDESEPGLPALAKGFELDAPLERRDPLSTPKKSFAKPSLASEKQKPLTSAREPEAFGAAGGTLPKDSLALEPKPFFDETAPLGMYGKLDDVHSAPAPSPEVIDLPAPNDLPAVKQRRPPKATALGLGGNLPKDSLDLPASFSAPASVFGLEREATMRAPGERESNAAMGLPSPRTPAPEPARARGGQGPASQLAALPEPALRDDSAALPEIDLPAPRDLPAVKKRPPAAATALGLGHTLPAAPPSAPAGSGGFEVRTIPGASVEARDFSRERNDLDARQHEAAYGGRPELSLELPPMSAREAPPDLALAEFETALDKLESKGGGSFGALSSELDLVPRAGTPKRSDSFGDLEPIALPSVGVSNTNLAPAGTMELSPQDLLLTAADGGLDFPGAPHPGAQARRAELDLELRDLAGTAPGIGPGAGTRPSLSNFGELDLGVGRESSLGLPLAIPARRTVDTSSAPHAPPIEDAELVGDEEAEAPKRGRRRRTGKGLPGWVVPLALVLGLGFGGMALGLFTQHGYFGVYLLEQLLPAAGDAARVQQAIEQAERQARSDTYLELRKALVTLSDARNEAGLNRNLLARSLLHEALYQLRFGEDAQSAQRSAAILARAMERGADAKELLLARAADATRRGELAEAKQLLAAAPDEGDRYRALLEGELALREKQPEQAAQAFRTAVKRGEVARGSWGLARALIAANQQAAAEQAARATLAASPRHAAAHALIAQRALERGELDLALEHVRAASGAAPIDGQRARPSRAERSRAFALEGQLEEKRDHPREAQAAYEQALRADPLQVDVLLGSGRMLMRLGRPQDALSRFDSALSAKPSEAPHTDARSPRLEAALGALQSLLALSRAEEALARANALAAELPNEAEVLLWRGQALAALARWDEAEANLRDTIAKAPKLFAGYVALSQLLFKRERPEEAARVLTLATGQVKDSAEVRRMLGHSELARNHLPEAVHQFEAALHFDARDPGALFGLVVAQRRRGALDAAEQALNRLQTADPTYPGLALERGQLLEQRGAYDGAIAAYRQALAERPADGELKLRLGAALVIAGQIDEAEGVLEQVLRERPSSAEAEHYLGRVLFARHDTAQAVQRFERAVNLDVLKAEYHMYLAWALLDQGNLGGALQTIQRAIERDPNLGDARWLLGRIQLRTGAVKDALVNFQATLRLAPGRVEALANMGDAYDELRDIPKAIKSYQDALKRAPEHADWWYRLGQLQLNRGSRDDARVALAEAVLRGDRMRERPSWLAEAHRAYGDVLRESKRNAEAAEHYRLFLELAPLGHPDRAEIEQLLYKTRH